MDVSAIWLVGPWTSREEFRSLYYEVYKLQRLLGSPSGEPEWIKELIAEVVSSLKDHLGWKGGKPSWMMEEPDPIDIQPPKEQNPQEREQGHLCRKEAHQGKRSPLEGPGYCSHPGGRNRGWASLSPGAGWKPVTTPEARTTTDRDLGNGRGGTARCGQRRAMPLT